MKLYSKYIKRSRLLSDGGTVIAPKGDPYEYREENGVYYTKRKDTDKWIKVSGTKFEKAVRSKFPGKVSAEAPITGEELRKMDRTYTQDFGNRYVPKYNTGHSPYSQVTDTDQGFIGTNFDDNFRRINDKRVDLSEVKFKGK